MASEELTYLLVGIIILVILIDILIKKRRKSKDTEIEKIKINEKVKKSFFKKFLEQQVNSGFWKIFLEKQLKIFFWIYPAYLLFITILFLINDDFKIKEFPKDCDFLLASLTLIIAINILLYLIKLLKKNDDKFKKIKISLLATLFLFFSFTTIESYDTTHFYEDFINDTFYSKTKIFKSGWLTGDVKNSNKIDFVEIKYDHNKLYYNLKRFSNVSGIDDISKLSYSSQNKNIFLYQLEDEDGFVIAEFKPKSFSTLRYLEAKIPYRWYEYGTPYIKKGKGYNAKGNIYISKKSFKKIHSINIIFND